MVTMEQLDALYTKITDETSARFDEGATNLESRNQESGIAGGDKHHEERDGGQFREQGPGAAAGDKHHEERDGGG